MAAQRTETNKQANGIAIQMNTLISQRSTLATQLNPPHHHHPRPRVPRIINFCNLIVSLIRRCS